MKFGHRVERLVENVSLSLDRTSDSGVFASVFAQQISKVIFPSYPVSCNIHFIDEEGT